MIIGIYKITNPNGKIYIGQSIDIERRFFEHKSKSYSNQIKLKNSLNKYGKEFHTFDIIEECELSLLNERERYWQDYYNVLNDGLNCRLTKTDDKSGKDSQETKNRKSEGLKKPILQYDLKGNLIQEWPSIIDAQKFFNIDGISRVCRKLHNTLGGFIWRFKEDPLESNYLKPIHGNTNIIRSEETRKKMSESMKGQPQPKHFSLLISKPVIQYDIKDNFIQEWPSAKNASIELKIDQAAISKCCRGIYKTTNNYKFKFK